jgi:HAE1 family hydrophobic/amphiphilic exporter-1
MVSLSLVPLLASRLLRKKGEPSARATDLLEGLATATGSMFHKLTNAYRNLLHGVQRHRWRTVVLALLIFAGSLVTLPFIGTEFLPPSDEGEVRVSGEMEVGSRLGLVDQQTRLMESIVYPAVPELMASVASVGASGYRPDSASEGELRLSLVPATERTRSNTEIADDLRRRLEGKIPGMTLRVRAPQGQFLLDRILGGEEGITVEIRGYDLSVLESLAEQAAAAIAGVPGVTDMETSRNKGTPQTKIHINRDKAADLGLTVREVAEVLETAVAGRRAGEYRSEGNSYRILVQLADAQNRSMDEILDITLSTPGGQNVALRNLVGTEAGRGPIYIDRKDQQRLVTVQANVTGRDLGSVAADVLTRLTEIPRPPGFEIGIAGNFEEQQKAFRELVISLVLALVLVYMVLACQYESLVDPLIVMFSVPLAAVGVLLTLFLTGTTLNVQSYIGCIMLGGIVVNNAILLVDQAGRLRLMDGMSTRDALAEAGRRRLRPILMTTSTTILGLLPLAFGIGEGADAQAPLARAVIGGLLGSTLITLVLIPAIYGLVHRK